MSVFSNYADFRVLVFPNYADFLVLVLLNYAAFRMLSLSNYAAFRMFPFSNYADFRMSALFPDLRSGYSNFAMIPSSCPVSFVRSLHPTRLG